MALRACGYLQRTHRLLAHSSIGGSADCFCWRTLIFLGRVYPQKPALVFRVAPPGQREALAWVTDVFSRGRNLNQALVISAAAFVHGQYISGCDWNTSSLLETEARQRRLRVWNSLGGITRHWDYRHARRSGQAQPTTPGMSQPAKPTRWGTSPTCRQIGSYARAQELLRQGHSYLDGDKDGEACESLRG